MKSFQPKFWTLILFLGFAFSAFAQLPTHIEPGQDQKSVNIFEQPEYIIPVLALFVVLIGYSFWRRNRKKK